MDKDSLRKETYLKRSQPDDGYKAQAGQFICEKLIHALQYKNAATVMSYIAFRNEVPTETLNRACLEDCKILTVPYCIDREHMVAVKAESIPDGSCTDRLGIFVPEEALHHVWDPQAIDLVVVPGVVYNNQCYRIGYGKGFYDRFLTLVRPDCIKVGFAYELQMTDIPFQSLHDIPVDLIISEKSTYYHEHCAIRL